MKLVNYQLQTQIEYLGENKTSNFFKEYLQGILEDTSKTHDAKYLTKKERTALTAFLSAYKNVCSYNYSSVCAESLFSYFCYKLEQNGINTKPVPIEIGIKPVKKELLYEEE